MTIETFTDGTGETVMRFTRGDGSVVCQTEGFAMREEAYRVANELVDDPPTAVVSRNGTVRHHTTPLLAFVRARGEAAEAKLLTKVASIDADFAEALRLYLSDARRRESEHAAALAARDARTARTARPKGGR